MNAWDKAYVSRRQQEQEPEPTGYSTGWWIAMVACAAATLLVIGLT
jgi:hypothetical protein